MTRDAEGLGQTNAHILCFDNEIELRVGPGNSLKLDMPLAQMLLQEVEEAICDLEAAEAKAEDNEDEHV